jgi:hypothetical protein
MKQLAGAFPIIILITIMTSGHVSGQTVLGKWQLLKETTCMENELGGGQEPDSVNEMFDEMKSMSGPAAQVVSFKEKNSGEESTRILNHKKYGNNKNFLYRFDGETLMILDKKSQTISEIFHVDKLDQETMILSNQSRPCETKIFVKIKDPKTN